MYRDRLARGLILTLALAACQKTDQGGGPASSAAAAVSAAAMTSASPKSDLKRRRAQQIRNLLAKALVLDPQGLCLELGRLPCADVVHHVSLGSMDAYGASQYFHPTKPQITSPNSHDRIVLSACIQRAQLDLLNPDQAVIYKGVRTTADLRLIAGPEIDAAIVRLYQRTLQRDPTAFEVETLKGLYERIYAAEPLGAARNWMVLTCYSVLTSIEAVFF